MSELYQLDEGFKTMKTMTRMIQLSVLLVATLSMSAAMACTTAAWSGVTGNPEIAGAEPPASALPRVSGVCALELTAAGSVIDRSPIDEDTVHIRFYVLGDISSEMAIFQAFSDDDGTAGNEIITVTYDGTNFRFDAGGTVSGAVAGRTGWNMIQLSWLKNDSMGYTVNGGTDVEVAGSVNATDDFMQSVVLGSKTDPEVKLVFDDYEAHRETPVDGLLVGDANSDGGINSGDLDMVVNEFLFGNLAEGVVDCNLDGSVNSGDLDCIVAVFLGF